MQQILQIGQLCLILTLLLQTGLQGLVHSAIQRVPVQMSVEGAPGIIQHHTVISRLSLVQSIQSWVQLKKSIPFSSRVLAVSATASLHIHVIVQRLLLTVSAILPSAHHTAP